MNAAELTPPRLEELLRAECQAAGLAPAELQATSDGRDTWECRVELGERAFRFGSGPRKSLPLNSSFGGTDRASQKVLNYSGVNVTIEDFENNVRATSGPGNLAVAAICSDPPPNPSRRPRRVDRVIATRGWS